MTDRELLAGVLEANAKGGKRYVALVWPMSDIDDLCNGFADLGYRLHTSTLLPFARRTSDVLQPIGGQENGRVLQAVQQAVPLMSMIFEKLNEVPYATSQSATAQA